MKSIMDCPQCGVTLPVAKEMADTSEQQRVCPACETQVEAAGELERSDSPLPKGI